MASHVKIWKEFLNLMLFFSMLLKVRCKDMVNITHGKVVWNSIACYVLKSKTNWKITTQLLISCRFFFFFFYFHDQRLYLLSTTYILSLGNSSTACSVSVGNARFTQNHNVRDRSVSLHHSSTNQKVLVTLSPVTPKNC